MTINRFVRFAYIEGPNPGETCDSIAGAPVNATQIKHDPIQLSLQARLRIAYRSDWSDKAKDAWRDSAQRRAFLERPGRLFSVNFGNGYVLLLIYRKGAIAFFDDGATTEYIQDFCTSIEKELRVVRLQNDKLTLVEAVTYLPLELEVACDRY